MNQTKQAIVALVGHCGPDSSFLRMAVSGSAPGTRVVMLDSDEELEAALGAGEIDLLMLNRRLGFGFEVEDGIELLRRIKQARPQQKVMIISNYAEAQQAAESAGALPGFGKREIGSTKARERITAAVGAIATPA